MADDIVVLTNAVAEGGKDPFAKGDDDQVGHKEDGCHLVDCPTIFIGLFLYLSR